LGITYAISKVVLIFALALTGFSLEGAIVGNALASVAALIVAVPLTRLSKASGRLHDIPYIQFVVPNILYFVGLYLLLCIDLWSVKYYLTDVEVGYYVSAGALAKVPYVLSIALSASLLPSLSRATKLRDESLVRSIVEESLRYLLMFLLLVSVVVVSTSSSLVVLLFGADFEPAAPALSILIVGLSLVTLFAVLNTILMARNRMTTCFVITFGLITFDLIANALLVPELGLEGAALATTAVGLIGTVITGLLVFKETRTLIPWVSWMRMVATGLVVLGLSLALPRIDSLVLIKGVVITVLYFAFLAMIGELKGNDISRLRAAISRG
jgi:stage V sporulation protein B